MSSPSPASARILVVEDDPGVGRMLETALKRRGYGVELAGDGPSGLEAFGRAPPDLVLLDWMLPGLDGPSVCRRIRLSSTVPILMLTARDEVIDRVHGLEMGADDYVPKPFALAELMARIQALLRRSQGSQDRPSSGETLTLGPYRIETKTRQVFRGAEALELTATEFDLLEFLARNPRQVFRREDLLERVWGYDATGYGRTVDSTIQRLRKKVEVDPQRPQLIHTLRGVGYKLEYEE